MLGICSKSRLDCLEPKRRSTPSPGLDSVTESPVSNIRFGAVRQKLPGRVRGRLCSLRALCASALGGFDISGIEDTPES